MSSALDPTRVARRADPVFVAGVHAEAVAQGLPPMIDDDGFYRLWNDALVVQQGGERGAPTGVELGPARSATRASRPRRSKPAA